MSQSLWEPYTTRRFELQRKMVQSAHAVRRWLESVLFEWLFRSLLIFNFSFCFFFIAASHKQLWYARILIYENKWLVDSLESTETTSKIREMICLHWAFVSFLFFIFSVANEMSVKESLSLVERFEKWIEKIALELETWLWIIDHSKFIFKRLT